MIETSKLIMNCIFELMKVKIYKKIKRRLRILVKNIFNLKDKYFYSEGIKISGYRILYFLFFKIRQIILLSKIRLKYGSLYYSKIYFINPREIEYLSGSRDNKWQYFSRILGGDWDQSKRPLIETDLYQALRERFHKGKNWEDTKYYKRVLRDINNGIIRHYNNREQWNNRIKKTELRYYRIKNNGYKTQTEMNLSRSFMSKIDIIKNLDEISVNIGRDGQILCLHGRHRLSIAILLNLSKIPVIIFARHKIWMEFRQNLLIYFRNYENSKQCNFLTHPDLQKLHFKPGEVLYRVIRENISASEGKILVINARVGFFCHKLENEGFDCYAQEEDLKLNYLLRKLKKVENKGFQVISESVLEYSRNRKLEFDVVLAIQGFHKYLETKENYFDLVNFLQSLRIKELILGTWNDKKSRKKDLYKNLNQNQFVNFILKNSCLNEAHYIGKTFTGRYLYKFTSERASS